MNKENGIKITILVTFLLLFLFGSRLPAVQNKVECTKEECGHTHEEHGELNFRERFHVENGDNYVVAVMKSSANFWEANGTGMTFAIIIGGAALSLALSYKKFNKLLENKGIKGAAIGSLLGMPLNMCANCSAVTSMGMNAKGGSAESTLGVILGGALLNFIGIVTMFGLFDPSVVVSRIVFSLIMILVVVPIVSKMVKTVDGETGNTVMQSGAFNQISCYFPNTSYMQTIIKSVEDWLLASGNIAYKLIPLMIVGTVFTAIVRVIFPNEYLETLVAASPIIIVATVSLIGTLLSIPVLFEILLGVILLQLGFSNGAIAAMVFTAPSFGIFTLVLTREKLGGIKVPLILIVTTFVFGIGAGFFAEFLDGVF